MFPEPTDRKVIPSWEMNCVDDEVESSNILVLGPMADEHKCNPCWFPVRGCVDDSHTIETRSSSRRSSASSQCLDVKTNLMFQAANMKHKSRLVSQRQTSITFWWNAICKAMGDMDHFWKEIKEQVTTKRLNNPKRGICVQDIQGEALSAPDPTSLLQG